MNFDDFERKLHLFFGWIYLACASVFMVGTALAWLRGHGENFAWGAFSFGVSLYFCIDHFRSAYDVDE